MMIGAAIIPMLCMWIQTLPIVIDQNWISDWIIDWIIDWMIDGIIYFVIDWINDCLIDLLYLIYLQ